MKKKVKKERLPASNIDAIKQIRRKQIIEIKKRQKDGGRLQSYDYAFMREMLQEETDAKTASEKRVKTQLSIESTLPSANIKAFHRLVELIDSKNEVVALNACCKVKNWNKEEAPPEEEYEIEDAQPEKEKVVSIKAA